ncbi:hypothetical protein I204_01543 [Kwoniella mangroviensis CBS 8886]|nr:hypothetical protein I204_01543 [Kwoniella mangroviensis CBS 8886]
MSAARWSNITAQDRRRIDRYRTSYDDWNEPHNFSFNNHLIDQYEGGPDALKLLYEESECLIGQNWLNDMVISHYMDLIVTSSPISVLSLGPQFLSHCEIVDNNERVEQLMYLLMLEWAEMVWNSEGRNSPFPGNDWQIVQITNGPRQPNQYDCGVYCCQALHELA